MSIEIKVMKGWGKGRVVDLFQSLYHIRVLAYSGILYHNLWILLWFDCIPFITITYFDTIFLSLGYTNEMRIKEPRKKLSWGKFKAKEEIRKSGLKQMHPRVPGKDRNKKQGQTNFGGFLTDSLTLKTLT